MAVIIRTGTDLLKQLDAIPPEAHLWVYCGFDACTPQEIMPQIKKFLDESTQAVYDFERMMHAVALTMSLTGVPVNEALLATTIVEYEDKEKELSKYVDSMFVAFWGKTVNVRSSTQMQDFLYFSPDGLQLEPRRAGRKKGSSVTADRKALESIAQEYYYSRPLINAILALKEFQKKLEFLKRGVDDDKRMRCTFAPSATDTGRWSSYKNPWGRGGNFQNQEEEIRKIYVPDDGYIFFSPDLRQAESYGVGYYSKDEAYIKAINSGDIHTTVAKMMWPNLAWPGTPKGDKKFAEESMYYRHFSRREICKRGGHATNYLGSAEEVSRQIHIPIEIMEEFRYMYLTTTFPGISRWHHEVQTELQAKGVLVTALGRKRTFFDRLDAMKTLKRAIAFLPQSLISDIFKIGLYRVWKKYVAPYGMSPLCPVRMYADIHDGGLLGIRVDLLDEIAPDIVNLFCVAVQMPGGVMRIPVEAKVGWAWQKKGKQEMKEWEPRILDRIGPRPDLSNALLNLDVTVIR